MIRLGVTGGIGSGKSYVCQLLAARGIPIYYADAAARRLQDEDPAVRAAILAAFGPEAYLPEGPLNRPYLASRVFGDAAALAKLNGIVHPAVYADAARWFAAQAAAGHAIAAYEAAILLEMGRQSDFDAVVLVTAPEAVRMQRVQARDGASEAEVRARMARQWPDEQKLPLVQHVVVNDGIAAVAPQIDALLAHLRAGNPSGPSSG